MPKNFGVSFFPYHYSATIADRLLSFSELHLYWNKLEARWQNSELQNQSALHAFVLMANHLHILSSWIGPNSDIHSVEKNFSLVFNGTTESFLEPIENYPAYIATYRYIYRNPIHAGIVRRAEDYPFSSLHYLMGRAPTTFPFVDNLNLISNPIQILGWINGR